MCNFCEHAMKDEKHFICFKLYEKQREKLRNDINDIVSDEENICQLGSRTSVIKFIIEIWNVH